MTFNFSGVCEDLNVAGPGLAQAATCSISPFSSGSVRSLVPTRLTNINIIELGQSLQFITQFNDNVNFVNGDTFRFSSFAANPSQVSQDTIPRSLEVTIVADNAFNEQIFMAWIINYSGNCDAFPVFDSPGQNIGWTTLVSTPRNESMLP